MMTQFCQKNSIIHETTIPYLPEQNGIAERVIAMMGDQREFDLGQG